MPRYKRTSTDAELHLPFEPPLAPEAQTTLKKLRNMWEFASLMQYIFLFGHVVKIDDDLDIEVHRHPRSSALAGARRHGECMRQCCCWTLTTMLW